MNDIDRSVMGGTEISERLRRFRNVLAALFAYTLFGFGCLLLGLIFPFVQLLWGKMPAGDPRAQRIVGWVFRLFAHVLRWVGLIEWHWHHPERLQTERAIIAPNHPSLIDVILILAAQPRLGCVVKRSLFHSWIVGPAIRAAGYIPNLDGPALLERSSALLNSRRNLLWFPEGTRTQRGCEPILKRGLASLAVSSGANLVPVIIHMEPDALSKEHRWYDLPPRRIRFDLHVLPAWPIPQVNAGEARVLASRALTERLQSLYRQELAQKKAQFS